MPSPVSITTLLASRPCFLAFCETFLLPFADFGPVDSSVFRRLASIFACVGFPLSSSGDNSDLEVFPLLFSGANSVSSPTIYRNFHYYLQHHGQPRTLTS